MDRQSTLLVIAAALAALWVASRSKRGQVAAVDALEFVTVTAKKIGTAMIPRGIRNNNPGNIEWIADPAKRWRGMIDRDGRFGVFDTPAHGVRAIGGELKASIRKGQTIEQAIYEWAPPSENDTGAYVQAVARAIGADPKRPLTLDMLPAAALAIIRHENGIQPYDPAQVREWVYS